MNNVDDKLLKDPSPPIYFNLLKTNAEKKIVQISYIQRISASKENGLTLAYPANKVFKGSAQLTYRIMLDSTSTARTLRIGSANVLGNSPLYWGSVVANSTEKDDTLVHPGYAKTIAHELGHVMNLLHRTKKNTDPLNDTLLVPNEKNLMGYGFPQRADLDLIQARVVRESGALK